MAINAGNFDQKITLKEWTLTRGSEGEKIESYSEGVDVYAQVLPATYDAVSDDNAEAKERCTVYLYKRHITTRWRIMWGSKTYDITSVDMGERLSPYMTIQMREV